MSGSRNSTTGAYNKTTIVPTIDNRGTNFVKTEPTKKLIPVRFLVDINSDNLGIKIFIDKIPFAKETRKTAEELNIDLLVSALFGGEDYELLFTVSLADFEKIKNNPIYSPIGHISKDVSGVKLYDSGGKSVEINHNSWTAFQK